MIDSLRREDAARLGYDNAVPPSNPMDIRVDFKRRKKLMQKRLALGHKQDDHEQAPGLCVKYVKAENHNAACGVKAERFSTIAAISSKRIKNRLHSIKGTKFLIPQILERPPCFPDIGAKMLFLVTVAADCDNAPAKIMIQLQNVNRWCQIL